MSIYDDEQIKDLVTGYLWYDAPWHIMQSIYPYIVGNFIDVGCSTGIISGIMQKIATIQTGKLVIGHHIEKLEPKCPAREYDTVYTSHVLEHLIQPSGLVLDCIQIAKQRIIHVVPEGDVKHKNLGTQHKQIWDRISFKKFMDSFGLRMVHYGCIKSHRMDSLIYVGDKI